MLAQSSFPAAALLAALFLATCAIYWPGVSGPFVFDDYSNLIRNDFVRINTLDASSLYRAAYSLQSGPLQRPVAMLSFALNHYFAGTLNDTTPYKLTNIIIHAFNGLLVFWLARLIFARYARSRHNGDLSRTHPNFPILAAGAVALLWVVHPVHLTSVLYVIQRMVELSALFTLLALICYLKGRERIVAGDKAGAWLIASGIPIFGLLGVLSKENAVLLPAFIIVLELALFPNETPWRLWHGLSSTSRRVLAVGVGAVLAVLLAWAVQYALPGYGSRDFTLTQRVLTETRVLFFYLALILVPRVDAFSLYHDISLSTSLLAPWTTLPSVLGLLGLLAAGVVWRRQFPLLSLGILWFMAAHALESTIFSLELVHEHRNYLASLGILLALVHGIYLAGVKLGRRPAALAFIAALAIGFAGTTYLRSVHWSDHYSLAFHEALYRPDSAAAQAELAFAQAYEKQLYDGIRSMRRAGELEPAEPAFMINLHLLAAHGGVELPESDNQEVIRRLVARNYVSASTSTAIQNINMCMQATCRSLLPHVEQWLSTILKMLPPAADRSYYYYVLGRAQFELGKVDQAILTLRSSFTQDPKYLHPLFELVQIHVQLGQIDRAEQVLAELRTANKHSLHPRDRQIEKLTKTIESIKRGRPAANASPAA